MSTLGKQLEPYVLQLAERDSSISLLETAAHASRTRKGASRAMTGSKAASATLEMKQLIEAQDFIVEIRES